MLFYDDDEDDLRGVAPFVFNGDRKRTEEFLTEWELYRGVNRHHPLMVNAYSRTMLFFSYIQGELTLDWVQDKLQWLRRQMTHGVAMTNEGIWNLVQQAFSHRFTDRKSVV